MFLPIQLVMFQSPELGSSLPPISRPYAAENGSPAYPKNGRENGMDMGSETFEFANRKWNFGLIWINLGWPGNLPNFDCTRTREQKEKPRGKNQSTTFCLSTARQFQGKRSYNCTNHPRKKVIKDDLAWYPPFQHRMNSTLVSCLIKTIWPVLGSVSFMKKYFT